MCDRSFETPHQLERHQERKRHWGCDACDHLFNSLVDLEEHKVNNMDIIGAPYCTNPQEEMEHWSDDEYESEEDEEDDDEVIILPPPPLPLHLPPPV